MSLKAHDKAFERGQKTCHALHLSLVLSGMDVLYEPRENFCCIFSSKNYRQALRRDGEVDR